MITHFKWLILIWNLATPASRKLYRTAVSFIGVDASPDDRAPDELGCAETVNDIVFAAFGDYAGGDLSTFRMYHAIKNNRKFIQVTKPIQGDIILSPTGYGSGAIKNGHVGIVGAGNIIMSNSSANGTFQTTYTIESWEQRYKVEGGYPIYYYRRLTL